MKTAITSLILLLTLSGCGQTVDTRKFIEVTGSAEMTVQPDEVQLQITLGDNRKTGGKKIEEIETEFKEILRRNNVKPESIKFEGASNNWWYYWQKRHGMNSITVNVTLDAKSNILQLVKDLDKPWVMDIAIAKTDHKDITRFRKEVKIQAMKAAKEKAGYLVESVGDKIGGILSVEEIPDSQPDFRSQQRLMANVAYESDQQSTGVDNVAEIKLRYEIKVKFEIQ